MGRRLKGGSGLAAERARQIVPVIGAEEAPPHESAHADGAYTQEMTEEFSDAQAQVQARVDRESPRGDSSERGGRWGPVTTTILSVGDPRAAYDRLRAELTLGDGATQYGEILAAADGAERNMLDASRLHRAARLEEEDVRHDVGKREEVLRSAARAELEKEKLAGERSKAPTIQDVTDRMLAAWPDEVHSLARKRDEIHGVVAVTETLETAWRSRASTLREMLARYAPTRIS